MQSLNLQCLMRSINNETTCWFAQTHTCGFLVAVTDLLPVYLAFTSAGVCEMHSGSTFALVKDFLVTDVWCVKYNMCGAVEMIC